MTQGDGHPILTQEDDNKEVDIPMNEDEPTNKKPSTRMGRQRLVSYLYFHILFSIS